MRNKPIIIAAFICLFMVSVQAQNVSKEAGTYERKSITYINTLLPADSTIRNLSEGDVKIILEKLKSDIPMKRFDYNQIPESFVEEFLAEMRSPKSVAPAVDSAQTEQQQNLSDTLTADSAGSISLTAGAADSSASRQPQNLASVPDTTEKDSAAPKAPAGKPVDSTFIKMFKSLAPEKMSQQELDKISQSLERTVIPKILQVIDAAKEMRAANLTSEQQRNSFMADKAKSLGITLEDIQKVMNSAYIFVPVASNYKIKQTDTTYEFKLELGMIWFRIATGGEKARAVVVVKKFESATGSATPGKTYNYRKLKIPYSEMALRTAVNTAVKNLVLATQSIEDFRLSSQVTEKGFGSVKFPLGKNEGLAIDDKFRIVDMVEQADGSVKQEPSGWVLLKSVGDSSNKHGYKSRAQVIGGSAYTGAILSEYPRSGFEMLFKARTFPFSSAGDTSDDVFDSLKLSSAYGAQIDLLYNLGRGMGISQFFFDFGFAYGWGGAKGKATLNPAFSFPPHKLKSCDALDFDFSLVKKFYIGRLALVLQPTFGIMLVDVKSETIKDTTYSWTNMGLGLTWAGGLEWALGPACNFGLTAGLQNWGKFDQWSINQKLGKKAKWEKYQSNDVTGTAVDYKGLTIHAYFTWSLPWVPFDPYDLFRSSMD